MYRTIRLVVVDAEGNQESALIRAARDSDDKLAPKTRRHRQYNKSLTPEEIYHRQGQFGAIALNEQRQLWLFAARTTSEPDDEMIREIQAEGADGFIFVVNCAKPELFPETKRLIEKFCQYAPVPCLAAANGLHAAELAPATLRDALQLPDEVDLMPCNLSDRTSALEVILATYKLVEADTQG